MKVLNVNTHIDPVTGGGTAERTIQMSKYLVKAGIECTILTTDLGLTPDRIRSLDGVNIIELPCINRRFYTPKFSYTKVKSIVENVDIVHLMNHWNLLNALVYWVAQRLKKPYVVCPAGSLQIYGRSKILKKIYNSVVGKKIVRNAAFCIAVTPNEIPHFLPYGVDVNKIITIYNGVDPENFLARDNPGFRRKYGLSDDPIILFMGRLNLIKGPDLLLQAFCNVKNQLNGYQLVFAGPDEGMLCELRKVVADNRMEGRIHFIGYVGSIEKSQAYQVAELLVIPSRMEAMSIVVAEAGITGTPVLLTDQCGFDEIETINGGKVVPASVEGIQKGLLEVLRDKTALKTMGKNIEKYIRERHVWDSIINEYVNLYDRILNNVS